MTDEKPFSRVVRVETVPREGLTLTIGADAAQRAALARLNGAREIAELSATLELTRASRGMVRIVGALHAALTQVCVVSLEPFATTIDAPIEARFAPPRETPAPRRGAPDVAEDLRLDDEDEPDPIVEGKIDLGALVAEFFALAVDPYPRKPGAEFTPPPVEDDGGSPFRALAARPKAR